jgi:hypothetical protein
MRSFSRSNKACLLLERIWDTESEESWRLLKCRNLTIGQMQGKFQMIVIRHTGHAIQEDEPDEFANVLLNFISRNRIGSHGVEVQCQLHFTILSFLYRNLFLCSTSEVERKIQVLVSLRQIYLCKDTTVSHHFASCVFPDSRYTTTNHFEVCKLG